MFTFGSFDTDAVPGILATLRAWPAPNLKPETVPLLDGEFYARTGLGPVQFVFDVLLRASTPAGVHALRDQLVGACSPLLGVQALVPETGEGWVWWAATSEVSDFERGLWVNNVECHLRGQVTFLVPEGVGWANPDETATGAPSATITRTRGNLPSFPTITVEGNFDGVAVQVGAATVDVDVPVAPGQRLVLDYQGLDFGVWAGAVKVAHAAPGMTDFTRHALPLGATTVTATPTSGTVTSVGVAANSRRA